jgi:rsbT co-antagonist protein RsbR
MSLRAKLSFALAGSLALIVLLVLFAVNRMTKINTEAGVLGNHVIPTVLVVNQISNTLADYRVLQSDHIAANSDDSRGAVEQRMQIIEQRMEQLLAEFDTIVRVEDRPPFERFRAVWPGFVARTENQLIPASRAGIYIRAFSSFNAMGDDYAELQSAADELITITKEDARIALAQSQQLLDQSLIVLGGATLLALLVATIGWAMIALPIRNAINQLLAVTKAIGAGNFETPIALQDRSEFTTLADGIRQMQAALLNTRQDVDVRQQALEQRSRELEATLTSLRSANARSDQLSAEIRALSSPVLPIMQGVLVMPLIGAIDSERATNLTETMLTSIQRQRARIIILDITGVPLVDTHVASVILRSANAARLLGAETVLVGMRPELAHTIVGLGINLNNFVTRSDLQSGLHYALATTNRAT